MKKTAGPRIWILTFVLVWLSHQPEVAPWDNTYSSWTFLDPIYKMGEWTGWSLRSLLYQRFCDSVFITDHHFDISQRENVSKVLISSLYVFSFSRSEFQIFLLGGLFTTKMKCYQETQGTFLWLRSKSSSSQSGGCYTCDRITWRAC